MAMVNAVVLFWLFCNLVVIGSMTKEDMYEELVVDQDTLIGKVGANVFYCLAWAVNSIKK